MTTHHVRQEHIGDSRQEIWPPGFVGPYGGTDEVVVSTVYHVRTRRFLDPCMRELRAEPGIKNGNRAAQILRIPSYFTTPPPSAYVPGSIAKSRIDVLPKLPRKIRGAEPYLAGFPKVGGNVSIAIRPLKSTVEGLATEFKASWRSTSRRLVGKTFQARILIMQPGYIRPVEK